MNHKLKRQNYLFLDPYQGYAAQPGYPPQAYGKDGYPPPQGYPPNVGFVNPGYPNNQPQPSGFIPLVPPAGNPYGNPPNIPPQHPGAFVDPEDLSQIKGFDFSEESIRRGFIRKVYSILSVSNILKLCFCDLLFSSINRDKVSSVDCSDVISFYFFTRRLFFYCYCYFREH